MSTRQATSTVPDRSNPTLPSGLEEAVVCVLGGGRSSEREVSLASAERMAEALRTPASNADRRGPLRVQAVEIGADGRWLVAGEACAPARALERLDGVDVFVFGLHGGEGENGTLQGLLTASDRAFSGTGVLGSAVAMDKVFARDLAEGAGLTVAPAASLSLDAWEQDRERVLDALSSGEQPRTGWAVKPREGGSSVGTSIVRDPVDLGDALTAAFAWEERVLVEDLIAGVEVTGGVVVGPDGPLALPVVEIRPKEGRFFDYEEKYSESGADEFCPPESVPEALQAHVRELSLAAHTRLRAEGYSRSDFVLPRDAAGNLGEPVFLELNTLPGMTPRSLLPRAAAAIGLDYRSLCLWIAADGLRRGARARR